jgi:hypothetical protein
MWVRTWIFFEGGILLRCQYLGYTRISSNGFFFASGVGLSPLYCGYFWPIVPTPDDRWGWLWSSWWNEDWQEKPKYSGRKPTPAPLCPPQIPLDQTRDRTRASAVGSQRLAAWAMAQPSSNGKTINKWWIGFGGMPCWPNIRHRHLPGERVKQRKLSGYLVS